MESPVFLAQSDTTAGFLCEDSIHLNACKGRDSKQNALLTLDRLSKLKALVRIPNAHRNRIRRSRKQTFVYRNGSKESLAVRFVSKESSGEHSILLEFFPFLYSSSANAHKRAFDLQFALQMADIIVLDARFLSEQNPSKMYKIANQRIKRIR